jgi:hypothetical protein
VACEHALDMFVGCNVDHRIDGYAAVLTSPCTSWLLTQSCCGYVRHRRVNAGQGLWGYPCLVCK